MSIIKNDIPILEFDSEKTAVIMPTHEKLDISLPRKAVFAFLGDKIDEYAKKAGGKKVGAFYPQRESSRSILSITEERRYVCVKPRLDLRQLHSFLTGL